MIFLKPEYLIMMLIPLIIFFFLLITNKSALELYFDEKILEKLRFDNGALGRIGRNMMLFMALIWMIVALARPVKEKADVEITSKSIDIMVALDISKSMLAADFYPSRLAFAKKRFISLLDSFKEANIGVIAFSNEAFLVSPMTQDTTTLKYLVDNLSLDSISLTGTDVRIPIEKGRKFLKDAKEKIIILFTDGGEQKEFQKEIERAKSYGESIYIYMIASQEGAPIKQDEDALKDKQGNIVLSKRNSAIKKLALETGGAYIVANYHDNSIALLVNDIKKKFSMYEKKDKKIKEYEEYFIYPLLLAVLFLLFSFHSFPRRGRGVLMALIMIALLPPPIEARVFDFFDIEKANEAYKHGDFTQAAEVFNEVVKSNKSPQSIYNLANSYYKEGKYKEAVKEYDNIIAKTPLLQYKKAFNKGNTYFKLKAYQKAIEAYEEALKIMDEEDLRFNLALAKKRLKEKEKREKKGEKQNKVKKEQQKEEKKSQKSQKEREKKSDKEKNEKGSQLDKQEAKSKQSDKKPPEISKKEEKMWQDHLERNRPKTMPMKLKREEIERSQDEKPW